MARPFTINRWVKAMAVGTLLLGAGGCLGPNPLFFVSTTAANATIMRVVNMLLDNLLVGG